MIDFFCLIVVGLFFFRGYRKGLVYSVFSCLALIVSMLACLFLSKTVAQWIVEQGFATAGWAMFISYILLFSVSGFVVHYLGRMIEGFLKNIHLGGANRLFGGLLHGVLGLLFVSSIFWVGHWLQVITVEQIQSSKSYALVAPIAPNVFAWISENFPLLKNSWQDLLDFLKNSNLTHVVVTR